MDALFRDDEIDGPAPLRPLVLVPALADERGTLGARIAGY
ncbi:TobH protein, partial [Mycolicibacterium insubricum]|nr:TobH protein [Mycolicibacterium insubricum]